MALPIFLQNLKPQTGQQELNPSLIPMMVQQAQQANPNLHAPSFVQGVQAGHAAAQPSKPGDLQVQPVSGQPQLPQLPQQPAIAVLNQPDNGYKTLNPSVIRNNY